MLNTKLKKLFIATSLLAVAGAANAGYELKLSEDDKISFGGYIKADVRHVTGTVGYRDFWLGSATGVVGADKSRTRIFANESRFNMKYTHGDVMGFIELDFWGGGGDERISNSANPRLRHAFIKYKNVLVGQTWSTFMNTSAIPETADFAGPANGLAFVRQGQVRYTNGNFQVSVENPFSYNDNYNAAAAAASDTASDIPDLIAKYTFKGDWGNVSVAGLARKLQTPLGDTESSFGYSVAGRINSVGKDDFRFQIHNGEVGRYVGVVSAKDVQGEKAEETTSYIAAYRHFWSEDLRSTVAYGFAEADIAEWESTQWSVNLMKSLTKQLSVGVEVGNFSRDDKNAANGDSDYVQLTAKYVL